MKKVAALDLGSNTFLCLIAEGENGKINKVLFDEVHSVRLGQDVQKTQKFHAEALVRASNSLEEFAKVIKSFQVENIQAVATAAARNVTNGEELFKICEELNIPIRIISGHEEAETTFLGAIAGKSETEMTQMVIDIGGGSTELIVGKGKKILYSESIRTGGVQLKDHFGFGEILDDQQVQQIRTYLKETVNSAIQNIKRFNIDKVISVAGTPTEIASIINGGFDKNKIEDFHLSKMTIELFFQKLRTVDVQTRIKDLKVNSGRADIIIYGMLILLTVLEELKIESTFVGTQGVRYGVAEKLLS